jgi:CHASE3 domain sensor protein
MAAFAAVVVVICVSSAVVYDRLRVIEWARDMRVQTTEELETLGSAMDALVDQETGVRGYLLSGDEKFLEPYHSGGNAYIAAVQKLRGFGSDDPVRQRRLDELDELAKKWRSGTAEQEIALMAKPETHEDARALESSMAGKSTMDLIRAKVDEIDGAERELLAERDAVQKQAFATAYIVTILGGAASLVVAILMGVLLTRGIARPITRMTSVMTALAKGDRRPGFQRQHDRTPEGAGGARARWPADDDGRTRCLHCS